MLCSGAADKGGALVRQIALLGTCSEVFGLEIISSFTIKQDIALNNKDPKDVEDQKDSSWVTQFEKSESLL